MAEKENSDNVKVVNVAFRPINESEQRSGLEYSKPDPKASTNINSNQNNPDSFSASRDEESPYVKEGPNYVHDNSDSTRLTDSPLNSDSSEIDKKDKDGVDNKKDGETRGNKPEAYSDEVDNSFIPKENKKPDVTPSNAGENASSLSDDNSNADGKLSNQNINENPRGRRNRIFNRSSEDGSRFRKNKNVSNRFGQTNSNSQDGENPENKEGEDTSGKSKEEKKDNSINPLHKLTNRNDKGSNKAENDEVENLKKRTKRLIWILAHLKILLLFGGFIIFFLFIMIILVAVLDFDDSLSGSDESTSTAIVRTAPASTYKCAATPTNSSGKNTTSTAEDMNLGAGTPLTKSEFIEKVKNFKGASSDMCTKEQTQRAYQKLVDKAGYIYDTGKKLGINPEIIFLRAQAEGYSPSCSPKYESYNNFYGMSCGNGESLSKCSNFDSVESGIYNESNPGSSAFFNWIVRNSSTESSNYSYIFGIYAWLWSEWSPSADNAVFNNGKLSKCGDWGKGSCCYSQYVEKHLSMMGRQDRANQIKSACESNTGTIKTLIDLPSSNYRKNWFEESNLDQRAYSLYQTENILRIRKSMFDLGPDNGTQKSAPKCEAPKVVTMDISDIINDRTDNALKGKAFADLLAENNNSIDDLNNQLLKLVKESGPGTRKAVVNAGKFLINSFASYNTRLVYMYQGGNSELQGTNGKTVSKHNANYFGINPYFGSTLKSPVVRSSALVYNYSGLDCSGFVHWALHNGGLKVEYMTTSEYVNNAGSHHVVLHTIDEARKNKLIQVGDVLVKNDGANNHHAALIVDFDDESLTVLEEVGVGLVARKRVYSNESDAKYLKIFYVADMSYWYGETNDNVDPEKIRYTNYEQSFNDGLIKVD